MLGTLDLFLTSNETMVMTFQVLFLAPEILKFLKLKHYLNQSSLECLPIKHHIKVFTLKIKTMIKCLDLNQSSAKASTENQLPTQPPGERIDLLRTVG